MLPRRWPPSETGFYRLELGVYKLPWDADGWVWLDAHRLFKCIDMGGMRKSTCAIKKTDVHPCSCGGTSRFVHTAGPKHEGRGGSSKMQLNITGLSLQWGIADHCGQSKRCRQALDVKLIFVPIPF
ncbi:hypothetical protein AK812_SmicGene11151 [Symbiodinium microadriaticum]|uniref:Uncharacterized protein n=1 Tax=Symbiodinium microadriaticum TaxID=2951 RepID=A0A1Q9EDZ3_SYMMI|nr:hypothetical protein AK812_SmicGene11151 [Symbiodinium microadriaticum]